MVVGFRDLVGAAIAPISKKLEVKSIYFEYYELSMEKVLKNSLVSTAFRFT